MISSRRNTHGELLCKHSVVIDLRTAIKVSQLVECLDEHLLKPLTGGDITDRSSDVYRFSVIELETWLPCDIRDPFPVLDESKQFMLKGMENL